MGSSTTTWLLVVSALVLFFDLGGASQAELCNMTDSELRECQPAVTAPHPPPPTPACCAGLKKGDLPCLCSYLNSLLPAIGIDRDTALQLPPKCGLALPAQCRAAGF